MAQSDSSTRGIGENRNLVEVLIDALPPPVKQHGALTKTQLRRIHDLGQTLAEVIQHPFDTWVESFKMTGTRIGNLMCGNASRGRIVSIAKAGRCH
jgi:hypothetical protein